MATPKVTLKLLINKKTNKVLFAEAGKDFVDFLFTLLSFPLGAVIKLLSKSKMVGSIGNLYQSIEELGDTFFQPNFSKATVLNPKIPFRPTGCSTLLLSDGSEDRTGATCPQCNYRMTERVSFVKVPKPGASKDKFVGVNSEEGGFVKGVVTYMVMDNLEVKPMSTISSITMLKKFSYEELGGLEEKLIEIGMEEGLNLLKASLQSETVLTSVFLGALMEDTERSFQDSNPRPRKLKKKKLN